MADLSVGQRQVAKVEKMKAERDNAAVAASLAALKKACVITSYSIHYTKLYEATDVYSVEQSKALVNLIADLDKVDDFAAKVGEIVKC